VVVENFAIVHRAIHADLLKRVADGYQMTSVEFFEMLRGFSQQFRVNTAVQDPMNMQQQFAKDLGTPILQSNNEFRKPMV